MVVPSTASGYRAAVSALRSSMGGGCVSTPSRSRTTVGAAPGEETGRGMPESVVREELEVLDIHVQGVMQLR
jgi:hypothetical protein